MGWRTEKQTVQFEKADNLRNLKDSISQIFTNITGKAKASLLSAYAGSSYVGINGQKVVYMRDAIRNYVREIQNHLDKVVADASTMNAFKGDYAAAVTEYVKSVESTCKAFVTPLLEFSDNLDVIAELYHSKDSELASSIKSSAREADSNAAANTYTEQRGDASYGTATRSSYGN